MISCFLMIPHQKKVLRLNQVSFLYCEPNLDFEYEPRVVRKRIGASTNKLRQTTAEQHHVEFTTIRPEFQPQRNPGPSIPNVLLQEDAKAKAVTYFRIFFTDAIMDRIALETNRYHKQKAMLKSRNNAKSGSYSHTIQWKSVKVEDLYAFFGIVLATGIIRLPELPDYWSTKWLFNASDIATIMTRDRFDQIWCNIHLVDNHLAAKHGSLTFDKLYKIRWLLEEMSRLFQFAYQPNQNIAVDEMMVPCKGRVSFKQYCPMKPIKRGIKVFGCCDRLKAYLLSFFVYEGKANADDDENSVSAVGVCGEVVLRLVHSYVNQNYIVYLDNFFTSLALFKKLLESRVHACGTTRTNRKGFPVAAVASTNNKIGTKKAVKGELRSAVVDGIRALGFVDKREVHLLSTFHGTETSPKARKQPDGTVKDEEIPIMVQDYNQNMRAVDVRDQQTSYYPCTRKAKRWWLRLLWWTLDAAVNNAHILFNCYNQPISVREYRERLIYELIGNTTRTDHQVNKKRKRPLIGESTHELHKIIKLTTKKLCKACKEHQSQYGCDVCCVGFCVLCFVPYHATL